MKARPRCVSSSSWTYVWMRLSDVFRNRKKICNHHQIPWIAAKF
jgi:hypothetical protein